MRVFVTGATGSIGSAVVDELLATGHEVIGLARSETSAAALAAKGAAVRRGDLDDLDALRRGAQDADAVVHLANKHDWNDPAATNRAERAAVAALGEALTGSNRPFVVAGVVGRLVEGRPATEADPSPSGPDAVHGGSENLALDLVGRGVRTVSVRFSLVHRSGDLGLVAEIAAAARRHGVSGYVGDGSTAWAAVHHGDAARLVRLALERAPAGSVLHAVAEEAVPSREIAAAIGRALDVPVTSVGPDDAVDHFGPIGAFFGMDLSGLGTRTRELLGWTPTGPTLVEDIETGAGMPAAAALSHRA